MSSRDCAGTFPLFALSGPPAEIGREAGKLFGARIRESYLFYEDLFAEVAGAPESAERGGVSGEVRSLAERCADTVTQSLPSLAEEIESTAHASGLAAWKLYALNARSEIYHALAAKRAELPPGECTAVYFSDSRVLGQNWDWHPRSEELAIVTRISPIDGPELVTFTEPGIAAKIGFNSAGLGVCLNILYAPYEVSGVPIHLIIRAVLGCASVSEAVALIESLPRGSAGNLLLADASGASANIELCGEAIIRPASRTVGCAHANHYIHRSCEADSSVPGSLNRQRRADELLPALSVEGVQGMQRLLSDRVDAEFPILRGYKRGKDFVIGTVASVVMDLRARQMYVARGGEPDARHWVVHAL